MAFKKTPSHLWQKDTGLWHFKLGIPEALRKHYPGPQPGKNKTHIVESLHTHNRAEALRLKDPLLVKYREEFKRLSGGVATKVINPGQVRVPLIRQAIARVIEDERDLGHASDELESAGSYLAEQAEQVYEQILKEEGHRAAELARRRMVDPEAKTLTEGLDLYLSTSGNREQSLGSCRLAVRELLDFLKVADCFPDDVPESRAVAYVDMLNAGPLSRSVKSKRLSNLNQIWKHMKRRGWPASPWEDHVLPDPVKVPKVALEGAPKGQGAEDEESEDVRPFTDAEAIKVFTLAPPADKRQRAYTRPLFRELYALGFVTGMRLNEIVSLRPVDVVELDERWRVITIPEAVAKTSAGARKLPICHPVAVSILDARIAKQDNPKGRLFSECTPGGPDQKPSWHVSKAMSRERLDEKRLGFTSEVNFHSTRRSFATMMENSLVDDLIGQQRYMGHSIPTQLHGVYSGGSGVEKLKRVVEDLAYPPEVEDALRLAAPSHLGSPNNGGNLSPGLERSSGAM